MRAHYLQHVPFEGLGSIEAWLRNTGYRVTGTRFYDSAGLPEPEEVDLLIVMGGPMSVNDENEYPWLIEEKWFVRTIIESKKPCLGICLGAQLIADAMGGRVFANPVKEIGWWPVQSVLSPGAAGFQFPEQTVVFHWHGETFSLPPRAFQIAKSAGCDHQAFQIGNHVIGLQFHLETTPQSVQAMVTNCRDELAAGEYIQTEKDMLSAPPERFREINGLMRDILEYLHQHR